MFKRSAGASGDVASVVLLSLLFTCLAPLLPAQGQVTPPEKFFGFRLGTDRKIARWDRIVEYFGTLGRESGRIKVVNVGPSTMGNPFLLVIVSAPENLAKLDRLRTVNARISDPRAASEEEISKLTGEGKAVICQSMSLHATEIGGTQMAPELAYDLAARSDEETKRILENVVLLMVPSFNPDGAVMVADWYQKTLGTEYEGSNPPWLYHKYAGHDNNRDAFQTNLVESAYLAQIMFKDWMPQAYVDHHHMGSYGARLYVPPYAEPVRPDADPLIWREHSWYGAHIAYKEEEAGLSGVINMAQYSGWGHFGFHWITPFHNIAGMLTESASVRLATPIFIHPEQLRGETRGLPEYEMQTTFPNPWPGGWWRLRDVIDRQKVSAWAVLDLAARNKETVLRNASLKARRQTERGAEGRPKVYVIPAVQHDALTAAKLVNKLLLQGIEIMRARSPFSLGSGMSYPAGSFVVPMAQPKMGLIRYLLGRTLYPDNAWTRDREGSPMRPYDMATDTMAEFMGVRVDAVEETLRADLAKLEGPLRSEGSAAPGANGVLIDCRWNDSFKAANLLLDRGVRVFRLQKGDGTENAGDFVVPGDTDSRVAEVARELGMVFRAAGAGAIGRAREVKRARVGMYQRYWGGNIDEGWTRLLLEQFGFPYQSVLDAEIKKGRLNSSFDVMILPEDSTAMITGERSGSRLERGSPESYPPEYRSGIGADGVKALAEFVRNGGTLVALGGACTFAIEKLELDVRSVLAGKNSKEFWCPGSTLKVTFDNSHPLAYGMPAEGLAVYLSGNPVFEIAPSVRNANYETVVRYAPREILQSGWLVGEGLIAKKGAVVQARVGEGRVMLYGIRPQHRAQTHGTFKLFLNALLQ